MTDFQDNSTTLYQEPASSYLDDQGVTTMMDDEAYLMTMVDADALLPSNMTFSGLFDGESGLNAEDLTDIASLLAPPQVSDDETAGSVASSGANTPVSAAPILKLVQADGAEGGIPVLPKLSKKKSGGAKRKAEKDSTVAAPSSAKKSKATAADATKAAPPLTSLAPKPLSDVTKSEVSPPEAPVSSSANTNPMSLSAMIAPCIQQEDDPKEETKAKKASVATTKKAAKPVAAKSNDKTDDGSVASDDKGLSEDERAKQCRDRNRQHARNTRLRKKAYVEELKRQLVELVEKRDATALEEAQKAKVVEQQREVRFQVMQDFLQLRGRNEGNPNRWAAILEEGFSLTLPKTHFQTMVTTTSDVDPNEQLLCSVADIMADSTYFSSFLQSLGNATHSTPTTTGDDTTIPAITHLVYHCNRSNFLMDGANAILSWTATSSGAMLRGAPQELELTGTMRARFCPNTNRLEMAKIQFDTGVIHNQMTM